MSIYSSAKSTTKSPPQPNVMRTTCSTTGIDCSDSFCSSNELTAQCTDQCVVIACSDPSHGESVCDGDLTHPHCGLSCDQATQCIDCDGFDAFLQCCDEYRSFYPDSFRPTQQCTAQHNYVWDASFENLWCLSDHQLGEQNKTIPVERSVGSYPHTLIDNNSSPPLMRPLSAPSRDYVRSTLASPSSSKEPINCMWDSCQGTFENVSDLVGHVNTHLPTSNSSPSHSSMEPPLTQDRLACLWAECENLYEPSSNDLQLLANHIFHEHLGLTSATGPILSSSSQLTPSSPDSSSSTHPPETVASGDDHQTEFPPATLPNQTEHHSCTDIHECRWKGCGKPFDSCDDLTDHITTVHIGSGKSHYECYWEQCSRNGSQGFQSKQKICRHVQSHTGHRPFQCKICQQNFSEAATLQQHIRRHTQEKPYVCDFPGCGKSFAITGALTIHKRTHNGDKPFRCSFCDRGFAESSNLSKHLRTHTGARPYLCAELGCHKSFARPDQLNRHKGVHKKQIREISQTSLE